MPKEAVTNMGGAATPQSFAERKTAQLSSERAERGEERPETPADLGNETPADDLESGVTQDDIPEGDDDLEPGALGEDPLEDLDDDEIPEGQDTDDEPGNEVDWEKRYKDLQSTAQSDLENRSEMEQEHAQAMSGNLELRFDLEDKLVEATSRAEYMLNMMTGSANRFRSINWAQVPPDKIQEVQAQAQHAFTQEQQTQQGYTQVQEKAAEVRENVKQREAAVARVRLKRSIPNWSNETYASIGEFAVTQGMSERAFREITDPVLIEALYSAQQIKGASKTVRKTTKRRAQQPRSRHVKRSPRDARGKYVKAALVPNERGSFAAKHQHRLAMERGSSR